MIFSRFCRPAPSNLLPALAHVEPPKRSRTEHFPNMLYRVNSFMQVGKSNGWGLFVWGEIGFAVVHPRFTKVLRLQRVRLRSGSKRNCGGEAAEQGGVVLVGVGRTVEPKHDRLV